MFNGLTKFTSRLIHAEMAQLAEQGICNAQVAGSTPVLGSLTVCFWYNYKKPRQIGYARHGPRRSDKRERPDAR